MRRGSAAANIASQALPVTLNLSHLNTALVPAATAQQDWTRLLASASSMPYTLLRRAMMRTLLELSRIS